LRKSEGIVSKTSLFKVFYECTRSFIPEPGTSFGGEEWKKNRRVILKGSMAYYDSYMAHDLREWHRRQAKKIAVFLNGNTKKIRLRKNTVSNLFRYDERKYQTSRHINLRKFNRILYLDPVQKTLEVQGLATYEDIVGFTAPRGFLPTVAPGFKQITIGGAIVGIAFESTSYRYGFVHDGLLEADVLLSDGRVVTCSPENEYADLFFGLSNSYGTLGYILRAKIKMRPVAPYVELTTKRFYDSESLCGAMKEATKDEGIEYIENLSYSETELYLTTGKHTSEAQNTLSIYGDTIFYKEISRPGVVRLPIEEYVFRYDPEWFWGLPESLPYALFRKLAPRALRNSGVYKRYYAWNAERAKRRGRSALPEGYEHLIQDWEVPWRFAAAIMEFALRTVDLGGKPWLSTPLVTILPATNYPMKRGELYLNLGCYTFAKRKPGEPLHHNTKSMDEFCFDHEGTKMLYSSTFMEQQAFEGLYGGSARFELKKKYDPQGLLPTLFEKAVQGGSL
jgi:FAD/FMN-containing dehydrogenase